MSFFFGKLRPTSGSIEFDGHAWTRHDLDNIGALIEIPPLYENLTAYEKVEVFFQVLGISFPFLISLFCVMSVEQEAVVGGFQEMLSAPRKYLVCYSKLLILIIFGCIYLLDGH